MDNTISTDFYFSNEFLDRYCTKGVLWGPLGYVTYKRTYARELVGRYKWLAELHGLDTAINKTEEWWLTCARVVEGVYSIQRKHCHGLRLPWEQGKAAQSAQMMYDLMFKMKFLPPGRGLWMMGTDYIKQHGGAALNNCAFVSTADLNVDWPEPFCFLADMSMLGVGVGMDVLGAGLVTLKKASYYADKVFVIPDTRQGWVEAIRIVLNAFVGRGYLPSFDFSQIRAAGEPIKSFGGVSSGPDPLRELLAYLEIELGSCVGKRLTETNIADIANAIGRCVVAGGVRRTAEILLGYPTSREFLNLKTPEINAPRLRRHGWASNNTVIVEPNSSFDYCAKLTGQNGEPGYYWLSNAQKYGRTIDGINWSDASVSGANPCMEQPLESYELCNLVETFPSRHVNYGDFEQTLKYAYLYAKTVTLVPTHDPRTNAVMLRNRRIGCSMSGIVQALAKFGTREFFDLCDRGYKYIRKLDDQYSRWLCVPRSVKVTSVKPSGTVSLLPGVTPGMHFPHSEYYFRVIRFSADSEYLGPLKTLGYRCVSLDNEPNTVAVYFPIREVWFRRAKCDVSIWEQAEIAAQLQHYWADNAVSCTITFKPEERPQIASLLSLYGSRLKGVSFLPLEAHGYDHAPYQEITHARFMEENERLKTVSVLTGKTDQVDAFCDGTSCVV